MYIYRCKVCNTEVEEYYWADDDDEEVIMIKWDCRCHGVIATLFNVNGNHDKFVSSLLFIEDEEG